MPTIVHELDQIAISVKSHMLLRKLLKENPTLDEMSERIMKIGDDWRNISYFAAKMGKNRDLGVDKIKELSELIRKQGDAEKAYFTDLKKVY